MLVDFVRTRAGQSLPNSLYAAQTAGSAVARQPLTADLSCGIVIVGAGFTGLSTALHLAERGIDCVVVEANEPGWGASGRNGGQVNPGLKHPPEEVARDIGPEAVRFSHAAPDKVAQLVQDYQIDCDFRRGGTLRAATDAAALREIEKTARQSAARGIDVTLLSAEEMAARTGTSRYAGGLADRRGGQLNPMKYVRGLAAAVRAQGVPIHCDTPVTKAVKQDGRWRLDTPRARITADRVLFATNGYSGPLVPRLARSLLPVFSSIVASRPMTEEQAARILGRGESLFEVGPVTTYYRVDAERRLIFGGRGRMGDFSGPEAMTSLRRYAERLWPWIAEIGWDHGWTGRVALTGDHYPHVHVREETGFVCVGYNGRGVAMASAMGAELAAMLSESCHRPVFPPVPIRPIPFQPLWPVGMHPALAWTRIRNRVTGGR